MAAKEDARENFPYEEIDTEIIREPAQQEQSEEAKAYESKAARVKALREKIRSGQY